MRSRQIALRGASLIALATVVAGPALADTTSTLLPTGVSITPLAAPGSVFQGLNPKVASAPSFLAGQAETTALSPDGKTLLVLTSGYNDSTNPDITGEWVFVFDVSTGVANQIQALKIPNAFSGLVWSPDGTAFYAAGGQDDNVHVFKKSAGVWAETGGPVALAHSEFGITSIPAGNGLFSYPGLGAAVSPLASGLAITADGSTLVVANLENDSISLVNTATLAKSAELDLRPGRNNPAQSGVPGGEFPYWVAVNGNSTAYISSIRDREIVVVQLGATPKITARIPVTGNPNRLVLNKSGTKLFVVADNADLLEIIDTTQQKVIATVPTAASAAIVQQRKIHGASPNSIALSPDERTAYVTNGGANSLAVINVAAATPSLTGLVPTGWYPNSVSVSADGSKLFVVNGKSVTGPNPGYPNVDGSYDLQLIKGGLTTVPTPTTTNLPALTAQVLTNDGFAYTPSLTDSQTIAFLHKHIKHVIYIVKENRTYDQILGDLPVGNGDPSLAMYGQAVTPNFHAIASNFVDLDNFYDSGEVSMDGWQWSTAGRGTDINEKTVTVNYGKGGGSYDTEGLDRDICVAQPTTAARVATDPAYGLEAKYDPDLLPGTVNEASPDDASAGAIGPGGAGEAEGFIWNAFLNANLTVRNYGMLLDLVRYEAPSNLGGIPATLTNPAATQTQVAFPCTPEFLTRTDPYFRGFDNQFPDYYRYTEWLREFTQQISTSSMPAFETVRFMHDHTGNFDTAIAGINTPELQQADNDYAVGLLVQAIAQSPYASSTLVFVIEDDSQDGPDHVDTHRSTGYIVGPYVKHNTVVSTHYTTVNMLRTIADIFQLQTPLSLNVSAAAPMSDVFDITSNGSWTYTATASPMLYTPSVTIPLPAQTNTQHAALKPLHDAAWWTEKTKGFDFAHADENDADKFNRLLWAGTMGDKPYPETRSGADLRQNRDALLKAVSVQ